MAWSYLFTSGESYSSAAGSAAVPRTLPGLPEEAALPLLEAWGRGGTGKCESCGACSATLKNARWPWLQGPPLHRRHPFKQCRAQPAGSSSVLPLRDLPQEFLLSNKDNFPNQNDTHWCHILVLLLPKVQDTTCQQGVNWSLVHVCVKF